MSIATENLKIHHTALEAIRIHAQQQDAKGGYEAVGFMACSRGSKVATAILPLHNHAADPSTHFFVEPWEQYRAEKQLADQGYSIVGIYHSHPMSEPFPSATDRKMARPGEVMVIYSVVFDDMRAYRELDGNLEPLEIQEG